MIYNLPKHRATNKNKINLMKYRITVLNNNIKKYKNMSDCVTRYSKKEIKDLQKQIKLLNDE
jgi:hypothetical protein